MKSVHQSSLYWCLNKKKLSFWKKQYNIVADKLAIGLLATLCLPKVGGIAFKPGKVLKKKKRKNKTKQKKLMVKHTIL